MTAIGLVIGLLLGGVVTYIYDRRGYHRIPPGLKALEAEAATEATRSPESPPTAEATMTSTDAGE
jgi:hypothetical protein